MKSILGCLVALALAGCAETPPPSQAARDAASGRAQTAADLLSERLGAELRAAMASGGSVAALAVCKERAPAIAAAVKEESGVDIRRTALRVRNPDNAPDAWELQILREFQARHASGEPWQAMSAQTVERGALRWMGAIPMGQLCSSCHGERETLAEDTRQALAQSYPHDAATGFIVGELRGAFTARVPLTPEE